MDRGVIATGAGDAETTESDADLSDVAMVERSRILSSWFACLWKSGPPSPSDDEGVVDPPDEAPPRPPNELG